MKLHGIGASDGIAIARIWRMADLDLSVVEQEGCDAKIEAQKFEEAKLTATEELTALYEAAAEKNPESAEILDMHRMLVNDLDFSDAVMTTLATGCNVEWAVQEAGNALCEMFMSLEDETMRARAADLRDVYRRIIRILKKLPESGGLGAGGVPNAEGVLGGATSAENSATEKFIIAADEILPSQSAKFDARFVAGCVTKNGSVTSHSAILARSMGIPCVVALGDDYARLPKDGVVALDGSTGEVGVSLSDKEREEFEARLKAHLKNAEEFKKYAGLPAVTKSGFKCLVCANIGSAEEALKAKEAGADGIGLFRSEALYLESDTFPSEERQFAEYRKAIEIFAPSPVVIRTLDLGSDKQAPYFNLDGEENPAMGYRAIRICLDRPDIFKTQLRALLRASAYGNLHIMIPMITSVEQVARAKEIFSECKKELAKSGAEFAEKIPFGIMVETPAAVVMSDVLSREVDFFSIGTNDLTQYTLAADRMNPRVADIFDSADEAVLRMISIAAKAAREAGIWVGVCGESAASTALTPFFIENGISELSVAASSVAKVKKAVCDLP